MTLTYANMAVNQSKQTKSESYWVFHDKVNETLGCVRRTGEGKWIAYFSFRHFSEALSSRDKAGEWLRKTFWDEETADTSSENTIEDA